MNPTAIDWLVEQVNSDCLNSTFIRKELTDQAKAMEKEQLYKFYMQGGVDAIMEADRNVEQYYNETFKSE